MAPEGIHWITKWTEWTEHLQSEWNSRCVWRLCFFLSQAPSGNEWYSLLVEIVIEIVDLPIEHGDFP